MKSYLKQFTGSAIALRRKILRNPFDLARLRLTILYTLVTMSIIGVFSFALLISLENNTREAVAHEFDDHPRAGDLVFRRTVDNLERTIVVTDISLIFLVAALGYIIAGRVLSPIKENMDAQRRFLADASHDLRTPLAIMKSEIQVLLQTNIKNAKAYQDVVYSNLDEIEHMSRLVDDLLMLARAEEPTIKDVLKDVNVEAMLKTLVERVSSQAKAKDITLEVLGIFPGVVAGDAQLLERAFQNVLQNAINYTNSGGKIGIGAAVASSHYLVRITDTGVGISEADLPHVYDRFFKASHSRTQKTGSGLGLPIVKQVLERHGGMIQILSKVGVGTSVEIRLPMA